MPWIDSKYLSIQKAHTRPLCSFLQMSSFGKTEEFLILILYQTLLLVQPVGGFCLSFSYSQATRETAPV